MKHYRILEKKDKTKQYIIQYLKKLFFGLYYWKKLDNNIYYKYDEALSEVKAVIKQDDYESDTLAYHYVDAYKIFKTKKTESAPTVISSPAAPITKQSERQRANQSTTPSSIKKRVNKSVFIPKT